MSNKDVQVEWVTAQEVAAAFAVDSLTVTRHVNEGKIPAYRFGRAIRIPKSWLDGELERFRTGQSVAEQSEQQLAEEGARIGRALAAATRLGKI